MTLVKWAPRHNTSLDFDRIVNGFFNQNWNIMRNNLNTDFPTVDMEELKDEFILTADIPGLSKKDVKITIVDNVLSLTGGISDAEEKEDPNYHYRERRSGSFSRSFRLPETINEDKIEAAFKNGVLKITLHKHAEILPREQVIKIS